MPRIHEWYDLAGSTVRNLQTRDVTNLWSREWTEAVQALTSDHRVEIEAEKRKHVRVLRTAAAVVYGLSRRLAPERRVVLAFGWLAGLIGLASLIGGWSGQEARPVTIVALALSFLMLSALLATELIDKLKFRDELELARELQAALMPARLPVVAGFELHAYNRIANTVGGDLYDFVPLSRGRTAVIFGDASGHGMAAGLVMAVAHASFRTQLDVDPEPEAMMRTLNRILCQTGGRRSFFTCAYLLIESDGRYRAVVAGHPPMLQLDDAGAVVRRVGRGSYPLGIRVDLRLALEEGRLEPGQTLLLYSDGLVEAMNPAQEPFGYDRVERLVGNRPGASPPDLVAALVVDWSGHLGGGRVEDDLSVAVIRRSYILPPLPVVQSQPDLVGSSV